MAEIHLSLYSLNNNNNNNTFPNISFPLITYILSPTPHFPSHILAPLLIIEQFSAPTSNTNNPLPYLAVISLLIHASSQFPHHRNNLRPTTTAHGFIGVILKERLVFARFLTSTEVCYFLSYETFFWERAHFNPAASRAMLLGSQRSNRRPDRQRPIVSQTDTGIDSEIDGH